MNSYTYNVLKQIKKKYKNISLKEIVNCLCDDLKRKCKDNVKLQELIERTEKNWPGTIFSDIERKCINKIQRVPDKDSIIKDFFEPFLKCPEQVKDCQKLREDYDKRLDVLKKAGNCTDCNVSYLKIYFIKNILEKNIIL